MFEDFNLMKFCKYHRYIFKASLFWYTFKTPISEKLFKLAVISIKLLYNFGLVRSIYFQQQTMEEIAAAGYFFPVLLGGTIRYFLMDADKLQAIYVYFDESSFKPKNERQFEILKKCVFYSGTIMKIYFSMVILLVWTLLYWLPKQNESLPQEISIPYFNNFAWLYVLECVGMSSIAISNAMIDVLFPVLMLHLGAQCEVLCDQLENITENDGQDGSLKKLQECIDHHRVILEWMNKIEVAFKMPILVQMATSLTTICQTLFTLSNATSFDLFYFAALVFGQGAVIEICLYCAFGDYVVSQSEKIRVSAYFSKWYNFSIQYQKDLMFFMHLTQTPIALHILDIIPVDYSTLIAIMKSSWSYFMMMRQFKG